MRTLCCLSVLLLLGACDDDEGEAVAGDASPATDGGAPDGPIAAEAPALARDGALQVAVEVPEDASAGLAAAAEDLTFAMRQIAGAGAADEAGARIRVRLVDALDAQSYRLATGAADGLPTLTVSASTHTGAMYGLYDVAARLGVRYHHPEETFYPSDPAATLPWDLDETQTPHFPLRGFHEHTQHPIVMSDVYLRPEPAFRPYLSRYIRWLARNRQNAMSWHMLKTVDLEAWLPYIGDAIAEAHGYGIRVGMVLSYVDQQQNNFKLVRDDAEAPDERQIRDTLTRFAQAGFDFFTFQMGSSEFTKPDDADVLRWLETSADTLGGLEPPVEMFAWIHTTCDLETEDGDYFYHLPLRAPEGVGAWVHTTMFYTLEHPAPVYGCEDFGQQIRFLEEADGERAQVHFPESAWWLGFDNNVPLTLPLTGWSRAHDIQQSLAPYDMRGHVTFTSGREWGYWQYDHHLTRATWDAAVGWEDYLEWLAPLYGPRGDAVVEATRAWTDLQRQHFYEDDPLLWFYVAGELPQDEIGAQAGILARRPKVAFNAVLGMDDETFAAWRDGDLAALRQMLDAYRGVFADLPAPNEADLPAPSEAVARVYDEAAGELRPGRLYAEAYDGFDLYVRRLEHAVTLYEAVVDARGWRRERAAAAPDEARLASLRADAEAKLAAATAITASVLETVTAGEARYRYPVELLAGEKPESLTSYPYGYLAETRSAFFWSRRDEQLATLLTELFETPPDGWPDAAPERLYATDGERAELVTPDNPLASSVLTGFIPQILFGLTDADGAPRLQVALDHNRNGLPDAGQALVVEGALDGDTWEGTADVFTLQVRRSTGERFGELHLLEPTFRLHFDPDAPAPLDALGAADLEGRIERDAFIELVTSIAGLDTEGVTNLMRTVFGIPAGEPLPAHLPVAFRFTAFDSL